MPKDEKETLFRIQFTHFWFEARKKSEKPDTTSLGLDTKSKSLLNSASGLHWTRRIRLVFVLHPDDVQTGVGIGLVGLFFQ